MVFRRAVMAAAVVLLAAIAPAEARVTVTFYSHDSGMYGADWVFPHAFVILGGALDAGGQPVTGNYGFTAKDLSIGLLWHSVDGDVVSRHTPEYVGESVQHLTVTIDDAQYRGLMAVVQKWKAKPQPSYEIDTSNCITFIRDVAEALGLSADDSAKFIRDPKAFLADVDARNARLANVTLPGAAPAAAAMVPRN